MVNLHIPAVNSMTQQHPFLQMSTFSVECAEGAGTGILPDARPKPFTKRRKIGDFTVETLVLITAILNSNTLPPTFQRHKNKVIPKIPSPGNISRL
jgi:hypothetical protein